MKTIADIMPHINIIQEIDDAPNKGAFERRRAMSTLVVDVHRELVAGRSVPGFYTVEPYTRLDGFAAALADELVIEHRRTIEQRAQLAERLEADGGENGAKAAEILRAMNAPADSKASLLRARGESFTGHKPRGEASDEVEWPKRQVSALEAALREHGKRIREARAARQAEEQAELRGFYKGRDQAWRLLMENQKRHPDTIKVSRAFLGDFQRDLLHMQKEG